MPSRRSAARRQSMMIAFCGMAVALSAVLMLLGGVIPIATYAVPLLCSALLLPVLLEFGRAAAWVTFLSTALITLVMGFDKEAAFFYLFVGYYPIVKGRLDSIRPSRFRLPAKLLLFTVAIGLMYALLFLLFPMASFLTEFREMGVLLTAGMLVVYNVCILLYDRLLFSLVFLYANRIRPKLTFLRRS